MKLLTTSEQLVREFKRLLESYQEYTFATAWASTDSMPYELLIKNERRIKKMVVGIHFYQTHPDFIQAFLESDTVRFMRQPSGTFHPKLYLFSNSPREWELLVGSANFTRSAFVCNTESTVLLSSSDGSPQHVFDSAIEMIADAWEEGVVYTQNELDKYRLFWKNQRPNLASLSGTYGGNLIGSPRKRQPKAPHDSSIISKSWLEFMDQLRKEETVEGLRMRLKVIDKARDLFSSKEKFSDLLQEERKFIAGIPNKLYPRNELDWGYFGSMMGAGIFKNKIIEDSHRISQALAEIPLSGQITQQHFNNFVEAYSDVLPGKYIATATRLLAMKRPDTFVCLDSKNRSDLCKDFGIPMSNIGYQSYWSDIICRIFDSDWWKNPVPKNEEERKISNARAAFLDSFYYVA